MDTLAFQVRAATKLRNHGYFGVSSSSSNDCVWANLNQAVTMGGRQQQEKATKRKLPLHYNPVLIVLRTSLPPKMVNMFPSLFSNPSELFIRITLVSMTFPH
mmetsp:Transcript_21448/g.28216  ORF Transcript_21448/g.28216 Transcript_21448/m.28216 type:complete len:102 (-) Transcript_21448:16-321(-)